jgi:hypothetical protein
MHRKQDKTEEIKKFIAATNEKIQSVVDEMKPLDRILNEIDGQDKKNKRSATKKRNTGRKTLQLVSLI